MKFLKNVRNERKKIKWPNKKEMLRYSLATILCVVIFSLFFTGLDVLISAIKEVMY